MSSLGHETKVAQDFSTGDEFRGESPIQILASAIFQLVTSYRSENITVPSFLAFLSSDAKFTQSLLEILKDTAPDGHLSTEGLFKFVDCLQTMVDKTNVTTQTVDYSEAKDGTVSVNKFGDFVLTLIKFVGFDVLHEVRNLKHSGQLNPENFIAALQAINTSREKYKSLHGELVTALKSSQQFIWREETKIEQEIAECKKDLAHILGLQKRQLKRLESQWHEQDSIAKTAHTGEIDHIEVFDMGYGRGDDLVREPVYKVNDEKRIAARRKCRELEGDIEAFKKGFRNNKEISKIQNEQSQFEDELARIKQQSRRCQELIQQCSVRHFESPRFHAVHSALRSNHQATVAFLVMHGRTLDAKVQEEFQAVIGEKSKRSAYHPLPIPRGSSTVSVAVAVDAPPLEGIPANAVLLVSESEPTSTSTLEVAEGNCLAPLGEESYEADQPGLSVVRHGDDKKASKILRSIPEGGYPAFVRVTPSAPAYDIAQLPSVPSHEVGEGQAITTTSEVRLLAS